MENIGAEAIQQYMDAAVTVRGVGNSLRFTPEKVTFRGAQAFEFIGNNNSIFIGDGAKINNFKIKITGDNCQIRVGRACDVSLNVHLDGIGCSIEVGDKTTMSRVLMVCQEDGSKIVVGEDCMFSNDIFIRTSDSHSILDMHTKKRLNFPGDVIIGDHVWVGQSVKINKGITIKNDSIIANASVVTKDVDANTAVAGIPARPVKHGITWDRRLLPLDHSEINNISSSAGG